MTGEAKFTLSLGTLVDDTSGRPWVTLQLLKETPEGQPDILIHAVKMTPEEARTKSHEFAIAAEGAETAANLVLALREQKVPEEVVLGTFNRMKELRGRF